MHLLLNSQDVQLYPTPWQMVYRGFWQFLPESARKLIGYTPLYAYRRMHNLNEMFKGIGRTLFQSDAADEFAAREGKRDVMSVLREHHCQPGSSRRNAD